MRSSKGGNSGKKEEDLSWTLAGEEEMVQSLKRVAKVEATCHFSGKDISQMGVCGRENGRWMQQIFP